MADHLKVGVKSQSKLISATKKHILRIMPFRPGMLLWSQSLYGGRVPAPAVERLKEMSGCVSIENP